MDKKTNPKVVAAALIEKNGLILIAKRKEGKQYFGNWEFPGGTVEEGETPQQCLRRELLEELSITAEIGNLVGVSECTYAPDFTIVLLVYQATIISGVLTLNDHEEIRWVRPIDLTCYDFPQADRSIVEQLVRGSTP